MQTREQNPSARSATVAGVITDVEPLLVCSCLVVRYGSVPVLRNIDLQLHRNEVVAIVGPNGAGKSSLLGALSGVVRHHGSIRLLGQEITNLLPHRRVAAGLAFVPEVRGNIFPNLTVADNLALGVQLRPMTERRTTADELLDLFPILRERYKAPAGMLSGGEQQMLAIAMAMGKRPQVMLLDEPTQGLAPAIIQQLGETIRRLLEHRIGVIVSEQNLEFAADIADRYAALSNGGISAHGSPDELRDRNRMATHFF